MSQPTCEAVLNEFLKMYVRDRTDDGVRTLEQYLQRFPGHAELIAREFLELERQDGQVADDATEQIGDIALVREIGRGGQGVVYLGHDSRLDRNVAIKILLAGPAFSAAALARFRREAEATARLDHPGICRVYDTGTHQGSAYIVMEYVEGEPLSKRVAGAEVEPETLVETLRIIEDVARALHAAHEAGIVHRDIKPGNILITAEGRPVITDFGLASIETDGGLTLTRTGELLGTPAYMSPEQIATDAVRVDRRSDVYSLGVTLYECLTGFRPFDGPSREATYRAILDEPAPRLAVPKSLSTDLEVVLATAIEKDRSKRYQTASAFADDLGRVLRKEPVAARPIGWRVRLSRWRQRNPALAAAILVAVLSLFFVVAQMTDSNRRLRELRQQALKNATRAEDALARVTRFSDERLVRRLVERAADLWPALPEKQGEFEQWLADATALLAARPEHERARAEVQEICAANPTDDNLWQLEVLDRLVASLDDLASPGTGLLASVAQRLEFAESVVERSIDSHIDRWRHAQQLVGELPAYSGVELEPQVGLVPLGPDPESGLLEFLHLATHEGVVPSRGLDGRLALTPSLGIVLILLPGGQTILGSDGADSDGTHWDPRAGKIETPTHSVQLEPFFLSKYELTQAQWQRFVKSNPSWFAAGRTFKKRPITGLFPVTNVDWYRCKRVLGQMALALPTEAQWEYACRAGTTTSYHFGDRAVGDFANVADRSFRVIGREYEADIEDGFVISAPAGSTLANRFGFHEMTGNVYEWCRDGISDYDATTILTGDAYREGKESKVLRGGSFKKSTHWIRSSARAFNTPTVATNEIGVRPMRPMDHE